jgi:hypothetical protein
LTPSGIEPAAFQLVAQGLNQLRHRAPIIIMMMMMIIIIIIIAVTSNVLVLRNVVKR